MIVSPFLLTSLMLAPAVAETRQELGIYSGWGAFRSAPPLRCYAIAEPLRSPRPQGWRPFASVSFLPGQRIRDQVHFRLSRQKRQGSAILLRVDDRTFQLAGGGINAWAPSPAADAEIVRALRTGLGMTIETRSIRGGVVRDYYQLRGAATAIDAAAIACAKPA